MYGHDSDYDSVYDQVQVHVQVHVHEPAGSALMFVGISQGPSRVRASRPRPPQ